MANLIYTSAQEKPDPSAVAEKYKGTTNFSVQRIKNGWLVVRQNGFNEVGPDWSSTTYCKSIEDIGSAVASILGNERLK
jgi:hypothetical protein